MSTLSTPVAPVTAVVTAAATGAVAGALVLAGAGAGAVAPFAASVCLVLAGPALPAARPVAVFAGYLMAALSGLAAVALPAPRLVAVIVAAGAATALMAHFDWMHPPAVAGACALAAAPSHVAWQVAAVLVLSAATLAVSVRMVWSKRQRHGSRAAAALGARQVLHEERLVDVSDDLQRPGDAK